MPRFWITAQQVQAIRYIYRRNPFYPRGELAYRFNVPVETIHNIIQAQTFTDVPNIDGSPVESLSVPPVDIEGILALREAGFELNEMAELFNYGKSSIYNILYRAGLSARDVEEE